jgi:hypothetical protein
MTPLGTMGITVPYFLWNNRLLKNYQWISPPSTVVVISTVPQFTQDVFAEGNLSNISPTIPIDISVKPGIVENVNIGTSCSAEEIITYTSLFKEFRDIFAWSYEEIPGIDPSIVVHEIKTYPEPNQSDSASILSIHINLRPLNLKLKNF